MFEYVGDYYPQPAKMFDWEHVSMEHVQRRFANSQVFQFVTYDEDQVPVGYCFGEIHGPSGYGFIHFFGVAPEVFGKGAADNQMRFVLKFLHDQGVHKVSLVTFPVNERAVKFYKRNGWEEEVLLKQHWWGVDYLQLSYWIEP